MPQIMNKELETWKANRRKNTLKQKASGEGQWKKPSLNLPTPWLN